MVDRARWLVMLPRTSAVRDAGLGAQRRDDRVVDVVPGDRLGADGEQHVRVLAGLAVQAAGLGGPQRLPGLDGLPDDRVDGFGERGAGLVDRHVQQADGLIGQDVGGVAGDGLAVVLPADAADPQPGDLVAAQAGEQPGQRDRPDQFHRVVGVGAAGQVGGLQVEPGPQQLGPYLVGDHPRVGADQGVDAARDGQRPVGVEPAREPVPFLAVAEEHPGRHQHVSLGARRDRLPGAGMDMVAALDVVADGHAVHGGDPGGAGLPGPLPGLGDLFNKKTTKNKKEKTDEQ